MLDTKSVGIRLEVASSKFPKIEIFSYIVYIYIFIYSRQLGSETKILRAAFRNNHFAGEIGTFIIRTASETEPQFQRILTNFTVASEQMHNAFWSNIHELTIHYNSKQRIYFRIQFIL